MGEKDSVSATSLDLYQKVILIKASQVDTQNFWGGNYEPGDDVYLILKKCEAVGNEELEKIYNDCPGLGFTRYAQNVRFWPYQFCAYVTSEPQVNPEARQYLDDNGNKRYDGLAMHIGKVWAEPRYHSERNGSYGKNLGGNPLMGHALRNPNEGISSETVTMLTLILNSDGGENPF